MSTETRTRQKPGRKSLVATHPQREAIEAACAVGISLRRLSEKFSVSRMNHKRTYRIYRSKGLSIRLKLPKRKRAWRYRQGLIGPHEVVRKQS